MGGWREDERGCWLVNGKTSQGLLCPPIAGGDCSHYTHQDTGPTEIYMGSSADGNAHLSIDISTNLLASLPRSPSVDTKMEKNDDVEFFLLLLTFVGC
jgi:hypothetical protein